MYKIVFIDDEFLIVEGLKQIIDWQKYNICVAGTALNAHDGIRLIREKNPDIIITDVRMKEIDGLKMISEVKKNGYDGYVIVLSGYQEFEYAQKAIENGVYRYLLKPINIAELTALIAEITEKLDAQNSEADKYATQMDKVVAYIEAHFNQEIGLTALAEIFHFDVSHLSRLLKKKLGMNYSEYIARMRVDMAKDYLIKTDYTVEKIAMVVGYKDDKYFREIFKKYTGISPAKYRKER